MEIITSKNTNRALPNRNDEKTAVFVQRKQLFSLGYCC